MSHIDFVIQIPFVKILLRKTSLPIKVTESGIVRLVNLLAAKALAHQLTQHFFQK